MATAEVPVRRAGDGRGTRIGLRVVALGYLSLLLLAPIVVVLWRAFEPGVDGVWESLTTPAAISAFWLTIEIALISVPIVTAFGILTALVLERGGLPRWARATLDAIVDLPFAISPVVVGLALVLLYGREGWLEDLPFDIVFSKPGMVLATIFVALPFVVREVTPVLREIGDDQEQAAATLGASRWQSFRRITLPSIRWGVAYGVVLSVARAIGEFGAVSVVSGKVAGESQTMTLLVEQRFQNFDLAGAYAASVLLAVIAVGTLLGMSRLGRRKEHA